LVTYANRPSLETAAQQTSLRVFSTEALTGISDPLKRYDEAAAAPTSAECLGDHEDAVGAEVESVGRRAGGRDHGRAFEEPIRTNCVGRNGVGAPLRDDNHVAVGCEGDLRSVGLGRAQRSGRILDRPQCGVVTHAETDDPTGTEDVHEIAVDGDAARRWAGGRAVHEPQADRIDRENGNVVASGVRDEHRPSAATTEPCDGTWGEPVPRPPLS
jgi:hypothetical protein